MANSVYLLIFLS